MLPTVVEIHVRFIFFCYHCLVYKRAFWLERFCRGISTRSVIFVLDQGVFISFIVIYDYFVLLSCSIWFLYLVLENPILLTFAHAGQVAHWWLGAYIRHRYHVDLPKLIGIARIIVVKTSTSISRYDPTSNSLLFNRSKSIVPVFLFIFLKILKILKNP